MGAEAVRRGWKDETYTLGELAVGAGPNFVIGEGGAYLGRSFSRWAESSSIIRGLRRNPAAEVGAGSTTEALNETELFRFATRSDPGTLVSRLSSTGRFTQMRVRLLLRSKAYRSWRAQRHMNGEVRNSPFVSLVEDPSALAKSPDAMARTIATGRPGLRGYQRAPDIGTFSVPRSRLEYPWRTTFPAVLETEVLFLGDDLADFLVTWNRNPF